jgi:hypothetical protein
MRSLLAARHSIAIQAAARLLLAFWLALHPVLGALAELHESADHAAAGGLHPAAGVMHAADHHEESASRPGPPGLHGLLHLAHCCGHAASAIPSALLLVETLYAASFASGPPLQRAPSVDPVNPFRPPISA